MGKKLEELLEFSEGVGVASIDTECLQRAVAEVRQELAEEQAGERVLTTGGRIFVGGCLLEANALYAFRRLPDPEPKARPWEKRFPIPGSTSVGRVWICPEQKCGWYHFIAEDHVPPARCPMCKVPFGEPRDLSE